MGNILANFASDCKINPENHNEIEEFLLSPEQRLKGLRENVVNCLVDGGPDEFMNAVHKMNAYIVDNYDELLPIPDDTVKTIIDNNRGR